MSVTCTEPDYYLIRGTGVGISAGFAGRAVSNPRTFSRRVANGAPNSAVFSRNHARHSPVMIDESEAASLPACQPAMMTPL